MRKDQIFNRRLTIAALFITILMLLLLARIVDLQAFQERRYRNLAASNHTAIIPIAPERGEILSAGGKILAGNKVHLSLVIYPNQIKNLHKTLTQIKSLLPVSEQHITQLMKTISDKPAYLPRVVINKLDPLSLAKFELRLPDFPGVAVAPQWSRYYPYNNIFENIVGHVGPITRKDLAHFSQSHYFYRRNLGVNGIERIMQRSLRGHFGYKILEVNALEQPVRTIKVKAAKPGDTIITTLHAHVQIAVKKLMEKYHYRGALIAINPKNGAIIASVSNPSVNSNWFVHGISESHWAKIVHNPYHPLLNRVLAGLYPPGSAIKPFYSLEALQKKIIKPNFHTFCPGFLDIDGHIFWDWYRSGFGYTGLTKALAWSVDVFFYKLALKMRIHLQDQTLWRFGFGKPPAIDLPGASAGLVPTPRWKEEHYRQPWYVGDSVILGIGQGYLLVSPAQLVRAVSAIANGGTLPYLHVIGGIQRPGRKHIHYLRYPSGRHLNLPAFALRAVRKGMRACVTWGTCKTMAYPGITVAGKTGTAEVPIGYKHGKTIYNDDSLFIGWAPYHHPKIAVAAVIEDGGQNAWQALSIAKEAIVTYLRPHTILHTITNIVVDPAAAFH